jgi:integrase
MIYWTAVSTGYRVGEMRAMIRANFYLNERPPVICLKARHTKNKTNGEVGINGDLAAALKKYLAGLGPTDKVFPFPATCGSVVDMLRRDLDGAGVVWDLPTGEIVDYHTLRSTYITWLLEVYGLSPKRVQVLARLKTLSQVQNYSRNLRIEDFGWLSKGPKLVAQARKRAV